jgi:hypothetical protein
MPTTWKNVEYLIICESLIWRGDISASLNPLCWGRGKENLEGADEIIDRLSRDCYYGRVGQFPRFIIKFDNEEKPREVFTNQEDCPSLKYRLLKTFGLFYRKHTLAILAIFELVALAGIIALSKQDSGDSYLLAFLLAMGISTLVILMLMCIINYRMWRKQAEYSDLNRREI